MKTFCSNLAACPLAAAPLAIVLLATSPAAAQFGGAFGLPADATQPQAAANPEVAANPESAGEPVVSRWKIGFSVRAVNANCAGIFATVPVPMDWPEQSVRIVESLDDVSDGVKLDERVVDGGVKQILATIPFLPSGQEAHVYKTFEVTKRMVVPPRDVASLSIPPNVPRALRSFLGISPKIETTDHRIKKLAAEVVKGKTGAWETVEAIYDWVRENVEYKDGPLKGAVAALRDKDGDCEELTSLFVALCRANDIPARTVWVEGHCYPEFYLLDAAGEGNWFPCQAAGTRNFGGMFEKRLVLQKGDNFKVPEKKEKLRYVAEFLSAKSVRGSGGPQVKFTRELVLDEQPVAGLR